MELMRKLELLGAGARYDVSCASSGTTRAKGDATVGSAVSCGICHSWTEDGRCVSLLKVLMTNACIYNCAYCMNRRENDVERVTFRPEELAELTIEFYKRNYIEGLFLSSGVVKSPDYTMELLIRTLTILRNGYRFGGYIHVKIIPGADTALVERIGLLADRVSVNIELCSPKQMATIAPDKNHKDILTPMNYIMQRRNMSSSLVRYGQSFAPGGQSTQVIVGAVKETDQSIMKLSEGLYGRFGLKRVYYSAYIPVAENPLLPALQTEPPLVREHRLYQADFLLRFYSFSTDEIFEKDPNLDLELDPKCRYALYHPELYPIEINRADYEMLLRVPGIGTTGAKRILEARRFGGINELMIKKSGIVFKRARHFITVNGKYYGTRCDDRVFMRSLLKDYEIAPQLTIT